MQIYVNGEAVQLDESLSVAELAAHVGISGLFAAELNGAVVRRALHNDTRVAEGDRIELVHFVGGG